MSLLWHSSVVQSFSSRWVNWWSMCCCAFLVCAQRGKRTGGGQIEEGGWTIVESRGAQEKGRQWMNGAACVGEDRPRNGADKDSSLSWAAPPPNQRCLLAVTGIRNNSSSTITSLPHSSSEKSYSGKVKVPSDTTWLLTENNFETTICKQL